MAATLLLSFFLGIVPIDGYYVSPSKQTWIYADQFCKGHCQSDLASIYSYEDNIDAIYQLRNISYLNSKNTGSAWIGLTGLYDGNFANFSDGSPFNYGTEYNQYPWDENSPHSTYNSVKINSNNLWEDDTYTASNPFGLFFYDR